MAEPDRKSTWTSNKEDAGHTKMESSQRSVPGNLQRHLTGLREYGFICINLVHL